MFGEDRELVADVQQQPHLSRVARDGVDELAVYLSSGRTDRPSLPFQCIDHQLSGVAVADERNDRDDDFEELGPIRALRLHDRWVEGL